MTEPWHVRMIITYGLLMGRADEGWLAVSARLETGWIAEMAIAELERRAALES